jgi:transglutaminase-like putative cysteine protease
MRLSISHITRYHYSLPARSNTNELRLSPEENERQTPGDILIRVEPGATLVPSRDLFGNLVHYFEVEESHHCLEIHSVAEVETHSRHENWTRAMGIPLRQLSPVQEDATIHQYLGDSTYVSKTPGIWREAIDIHLASEKSWGVLIGSLSDHVFETCLYRDQLLHTMDTAADIQERREGTCQDFSHLLIGYCRALGLPARYVSGYLYDPGLEGLGENTVTGSGATHAWVEVHVPGPGWIGIDPTNRKWVDHHYVSVASGRDYFDVAPVKGSLIGGGPERSLEVSVAVQAVGA